MHYPPSVRRLLCLLALPIASISKASSIVCMHFTMSMMRVALQCLTWCAKICYCLSKQHFIVTHWSAQACSRPLMNSEDAAWQYADRSLGEIGYTACNASGTRPSRSNCTLRTHHLPVMVMTSTLAMTQSQIFNFAALSTDLDYLYSSH